MADRVVKVTLSLQMQQFMDGIERSRKATRELGSEAEKLGQKKQDFDMLGRTGLAMGVALAGGLALVAAKAADFDQAMSYVDAATHETADNMALLRDAALDAGASTVFSATESANAIEELGKAGLTTTDILTGGLTGSLNLAAAGGLGVAEAAGYAATALKQFNLQGSDTSHVADLLAAGAGKAMGDVSDLSMALGQVGLVANNAGLSIEETTAGLAAFASQGLLGSDAGTSFKTMLGALTPNSAKAAEEMERLGINAFDAQGKFIGLSAFAGNLKDSLTGLTDQQRAASLEMIFGQDAVRAATALYNEGADGIAEWTDKVDDTGYAADTAARRLDNLKGDVEALGGAFDTALITSGSQANDMLRFLVQSATYGIDAFNALPGPAQGAVVAVAAVTAGVGLASAAFFLGAPKVAAYRAAIDDLGPGAQRASKAVGSVAKAAGAFGAAATIASVAGGFLFDELEKIKATGDEVENALLTAATAQDVLTKASQGMEATWWTDIATDSTSVKDALQSAANSSVNFIDAMSQTNAQKGIIDTFQRVGKGLGQLASKDFPAAQDAFAKFTDELGLNERQQWQALSNMDDYKAALVSQANELEIATSKTNLLALANGEIQGTSSDAVSGLAEVAKASEVTTENLDELVESIRDYGSATSDLINANSDLYQSIDDAKTAWGEDGFAATLDLTTQLGRDNTDMLLGLAEAANNAAAETYETTGSQEELIAKLDEGRNALFNEARQFFDTDQAAWDYVNTLMKTPESVTTDVILNGDEEAKQRIQDLIALLNSVPSNRQTSIGVTVDNPFYNPDFDPGAVPETADPNAAFSTQSSGVRVDPSSFGVRNQTFTSGDSSMQFTVNAPPGPSAESIGRAAYEEANWRMRTGT